MLRLDFFVFQGTLLHGIHPPSLLLGSATLGALVLRAGVSLSSTSASSSPITFICLITDLSPRTVIPFGNIHSVSYYF